MATEQQFADALTKVLVEQLGEGVTIHALYEDQPTGTSWEQSGFPQVTGFAEMNGVEVKFLLPNFHLPGRTDVAVDPGFLEFAWSLGCEIRRQVKTQ